MLFSLPDIKDMVYKAGHIFHNCFIDHIFVIHRSATINYYFMTTPIIICLIFFLASWVQGVSGFGAILVAIPLLTFFIDIKIAVPLCSLSSLIITTYMALQLRKHFDRKRITPLCIGAVPGILTGVTLLKTVPSDIIRTVLGSLLTTYALYNLFFTVKQRKINPNWGYLAGYFSGAIGAAFGAGGPPTIIYTTLSDWSKDEIKATLTGFFCFNSYTVAIAHLVSGLTTLEVTKYFLLSAPFVLGGTALGVFCYNFFRKDVYLRIIFSFLVVMGILMIL